MIEGTYKINFYYNSNITGHISGQYTTPDDRHGLETITVDEYYFNGSMDECKVEYNTDTIYDVAGYIANYMDWLVAVASAKTDLVFDFGNYMKFIGNSFTIIKTDLLRHVNNKITLRFRANNIIFNHKYLNAFIRAYDAIILILDCETLKLDCRFELGNAYEIQVILTDRLKNIEGGEFNCNIGIYNLSNLEHIGKHSFRYATIFIADQSILPNETVYNFKPTIVEGEYEGIQVLNKWYLIKFADNCIIEDEAFESALIDRYAIKPDLYYVMFDLCNISNKSGKNVFKNFPSFAYKSLSVLFKIKNTIRTDFFGELRTKEFAYCEDEQFLRTAINLLARPIRLYVSFQNYHNLDLLEYNLKYTPNINTNVTLCCDVNCLEYGVGHYTAEMTDDLNIDHNTLCVGVAKKNKYYRIKED